MLNSKSISHVGVLGMKWGKRNPRVSSQEHTTTRTLLKKKKLHEMSNDELRQVTNRLQLEKQFKDVTASQIGRGQKFVISLLSNIAGQAVNSYARSRVEPEFVKIMEALRNKKP